VFGRQGLYYVETSMTCPRSPNPDDGGGKFGSVALNSVTVTTTVSVLAEPGGTVTKRFQESLSALA